MQTETQIVKTNKIDENSVKAFVVLENKNVFDDVTPFYNKKFLNASLKEISERVVGRFNYNIITIEEGDHAGLISQIKEKVNENVKTVVVVFADACVIENTALDVAITRCELCDFVNLNKSFACKAEYLNQAHLSEIFASEVLPLAEGNVVITKDTYLSDLEFAFQNMIVHNLMKEKVKFLSLTDVKIDFSVLIGENTIINKGVTLMGESIIGDNCNFENATIKNSFIQHNCSLKNVIVDNSIIKENNTISGRNVKETPVLENVTVE